MSTFINAEVFASLQVLSIHIQYVLTQCQGEKTSALIWKAITLAYRLIIWCYFCAINLSELWQILSTGKHILRAHYMYVEKKITCKQEIIHSERANIYSVLNNYLTNCASRSRHPGPLPLHLRLLLLLLLLPLNLDTLLAHKFIGTNTGLQVCQKKTTNQRTVQRKFDWLLSLYLRCPGSVTENPQVKTK